jgi:Holliday junction resolvase RusA-like endonuclease
MKIQFFVPGIPGTSGSKRSMPIYKGKECNKKWTGKTVVIPANTKKQRLWMSDIKAEASKVYDSPLVTGAIELNVRFFMPRPKSHYGTGKNTNKLKPSAPKFHLQKPDKTKMLRAVEDALTGVIWNDDCQVISGVCSKEWTADKPGALIEIYADELI